MTLKPVLSTIELNRQHPSTKEKTLSLLTELEKELDIDNLSNIRETELILYRINFSDKNPHIFTKQLNIF